MLYVYEFDIAAAAILVVVMVLTKVRHGYPTAKHHIFTAFMSCALVASVTDCITAFTLSYSQLYPIWFNYLVNMVYYLCLNGLSGICYFYILVMVRRTIGDVLTRRLVNIFVVMILIEGLLIVTTPLTHFIFYFDADCNYFHGPLFYVLYAFLLAFAIFSVSLLVIARKGISAMDAVVFMTYLVLEVVAVAITLVFPRLLIYCFVTSIMALIMYVVIENPARHLYGNTNCYNRNALNELINEFVFMDYPCSIVAFKIENYNYLQTAMGDETAEEYLEVVLGFVYKRFKHKRVFCLKPGICAVVAPREDEESTAVFLRGVGRNRIVFRGMHTDIAYAMCIVRVPDVLSDPEVIFRTIDVELDEANANEIVIASADALDRFARLQQISHIIHRLVENLDIEVYYQPIWNCKKKSFDYAEALVRIKDDQLGYVSPEEAIPLAEQSGIIVDLGYCILSTVCRDIIYGGLEELGVRTIAINLSMVQCAQPGMAESITSTIEAYGLHPSQISFEITETAAIKEQDMVIENISKMTERGFTFDLDDFGSGFSGIDYLLKLPVEVVKIDRGILWRGVEEESSRNILTLLIEGLKGMGKKIIVEGVESIEMVEYLDTLQCDYYQGYYYSKPLSRRDYLAFLREKQGIEVPTIILEGE